MFVINQDCRAGMAENLADCSVDAIVTGPQYATVADARILDAFNQFHIDGTDNKA